MTMRAAPSHHSSMSLYHVTMSLACGGIASVTVWGCHDYDAETNAVHTAEAIYGAVDRILSCVPAYK